MPLAGLFSWIRGRLTGDTPAKLSDDLWRSVVDSLPFLAGLNSDELTRLKRLVERFLAEKEFSTAGGLELTDVICVSIATQGCLPILNLGLACYCDWVGIVVYPDEFVIPRTVEDEFGVVHEYDDIAAGEAWQGGPLLISWHDAQMAGDGYNVVIHEFAHKLDMLNGEADGVPPLSADLSCKEWEETLLTAYDDFCARIDAAEVRIRRRGYGSDELMPDIDPYASESPAEFFAVLSEIFFETPEILNRDYPELYGVFVRFYLQDPLARAIS